MSWTVLTGVVLLGANYIIFNCNWSTANKLRVCIHSFIYLFEYYKCLNVIRAYCVMCDQASMSINACFVEHRLRLSQLLVIIFHSECQKCKTAFIHLFIYLFKYYKCLNVTWMSCILSRAQCADIGTETALYMAFLKETSLVLYFSSYTPLLSVLSYLIQQQTITSINADDTELLLSFWALDFSHNITHLEKTLWLTYPTGYLSILCLLILLKLSFSSLVYHNNSLNSIILTFNYLTMSYFHLLILLAIFVSSLIQICHLHKISLLFLNHASTIFVT